MPAQWVKACLTINLVVVFTEGCREEPWEGDRRGAGDGVGWGEVEKGDQLRQRRLCEDGRREGVGGSPGAECSSDVRFQAHPC